MLLAGFIAVFAVLVALVAGDNLRAEHPAISPEHVKQINAAVKSHMQGFTTLAASDKVMIKAHIDEVSRERIKDLKKIQSSGSTSSAVRLMSDMVKDGYVITRHRANADCSGKVRVLTGYRLNVECYALSTISYYTACYRDQKKDELVFKSSYFNNLNCSGEPYAVYDTDDLPQCEINYQNVNSTGFEMIGAQCSSETDLSMEQKPGFVSEFYSDSSCSGSANLIQNMRVGACFAMVDFGKNGGTTITADTTYMYGMLDECFSNGLETLSVYTDSICTRIVGRVKMSVIDEPMNKCIASSSSSGEYTKIRCVPNDQM
jgi:hypothetical protein